MPGTRCPLAKVALARHTIAAVPAFEHMPERNLSCCCKAQVIPSAPGSFFLSFFQPVCSFSARPVIRAHQPLWRRSRGLARAIPTQALMLCALVPDQTLPKTQV